MAKQLFANNASSLLAASIDDNDLSIQVGVGAGALFPAPGVGEFFLAALVNALGDFEIVKIESRASDIFTVAAAGRGQEGTSAQAWTNGATRVELRNTKGTLDRFLQREGDAMTGPLDMNGQNVVDPALTGDWKGTGGQLIGTKLRGDEDDASNEIDVPSGGGPATAGGSVILTAGSTQAIKTAAFSVGMIIDWYGAAVDCPAGFAICDGTAGTPDMRNLVSVGVSGTKALNSTGGAETASGSTGAAGAHTHTTTTGAHVLTEAELPAHNHRFLAANNASNSNADGWLAASSMGVPGEDVGPFAMRDATQGGTQIIEDTGSGTAHSHPGGSTNDPGNHTHALGSISVLQPYRALHKIMFIGF